MESCQRKEELDESQDIQDACKSYGNKRKRRFSQEDDQTPSPPQKKTTPYEEQQQRSDECAPQLLNGGSTINARDDKVKNYHWDEDQFSLEHFCDELLYEIFKFLDTWSLMTLMNVSKRFQKFVLDKRLWEDIDLSQEPLPLGILEDMLERSHEKTRSIKLRGPSPSQHIEGEIRHFNKTLRNSLTSRCTKLVTMELFGVTLDFNQLTFNDFPKTLKRVVLNNCHVRVDANKSIFTGIETILVNLDELAIEKNAWFDPYYVMPISKLPGLRYLSLKGCSQMQEFIPYGSIAGRHGFKKLEVLDLSDTPLNDSDLQCFNAVESLKEIYLQCPEEDVKREANNGLQSVSETTSTNSTVSEADAILPSTSSLDERIFAPGRENMSNSEDLATSSSLQKPTSTASSEGVVKRPDDGPSTSRSSSSSPPSSASAVDANLPSTSSFDERMLAPGRENKPNSEDLATSSSLPKTTSTASSEEAVKRPADGPSTSRSSSSSPPASTSSLSQSSANAVPLGANASSNAAVPSSSVSNNNNNNGAGVLLPLVGSNTPPRSRFLPRPDHIIYLDMRNRTSPNAVHISLRDRSNVRHLLLAGQGPQGNQHQQQQQSPPPPAFEQMIRHDLFWDIINPLGRAAGGGGPDRLFGEENEIEFGGAGNMHHSPFNLLSSRRHVQRGSISDRGVCCFGRTRQPVQHGVIWIRFNNRPSENRFERFSVRDYKYVTDVSLQHLVQCSPNLVFLDVSGTSVTLEGVKRFKELKPECKLVAEHLLGAPIL